jgi:hypothetical protein
MDAGGRAAPGAAAGSGVGNSRRGGTPTGMWAVDCAGSWQSRATQATHMDVGR